MREVFRPAHKEASDPQAACGQQSGNNYGVQLTWRMVRGQKMPCIDYGRRRGKRVRRFFKTIEAAEAAMRAAVREREEYGRSWVGLPDERKVEVVRVLGEMATQGVTLTQVWGDWRSSVATSSPAGSVPIGVAIAAVLEEKRQANRRPRYIASLGQFLRLFARGREETPISGISATDIRTWIHAHGGAPSTKAGNLGRLGALFSHAKHCGWIKDNPVDSVTPPTVEAKPAVVFSPSQCCRLMAACRRNPEIMAWAVLGVFAGLRPEEAEKMQWGDVNLEESTLTVRATSGKVRQRRVVHLTPQAAAWLQAAKNLDARLPIPPITRRRRLRELRSVMRLKEWPQDVLRKTFASYTLTLWGDAAKVALEMGTSHRMLYSNYREVVSRRDAGRFSKIIPKRGHLYQSRKKKP